MRKPTEIISAFVASGLSPMPAIEGNRIFYTGCTASTLVWVEGQVVIEFYMMFPHIVSPLHSHPFENQMLFAGGDLVGYRASPRRKTGMRSKEFTAAEIGRLSAVMMVGDEHGFATGARGASLYNIQIWPQDVLDPRSAAIEFQGPSMGPIHDALLKS